MNWVVKIVSTREIWMIAVCDNWSGCNCLPAGSCYHIPLLLRWTSPCLPHQQQQLNPATNIIYIVIYTYIHVRMYILVVRYLLCYWFCRHWKTYDSLPMPWKNQNKGNIENNTYCDWELSLTASNLYSRVPENVGSKSYREKNKVQYLHHIYHQTSMELNL